MGSTCALIPIRGFRRTSGIPARRLALHVLQQVTALAVLDGVLVITDAAEVASLATRMGCAVMWDPELPPAPAAGRLAQVIDFGLAALAAEARAEGALVVAADLPLLGVAELAVLHSTLQRADLVLAPDRQGVGWNAMALRRPADGAFPACSWGQGGVERRLRMATDEGLRPARVELPGLAWDVDGVGDLEGLPG